MKPVEESLSLPRLSESGDPLAGSIADLRAHRPDATELASLASRLALQGIAVSAPLATSAATARLAWKKWALWGGGAASGLAIWLGLATSDRATSEPSLQRAGAVNVVAAPARVAPPQSEAARRLIPAPPTARSSAAAVAEPLPVESTPPEAPAPRADAPVRTESVAVSPPSSSGARSRTLTTSPEASPSPALGSDAASAPTEIELLRDARLALRQSPSRALELTESHARAFPRGKLTQERELIAISALVALNRRTAALSRAHRFEQVFPESPYRKQIGELLR